MVFRRALGNSADARMSWPRTIASARDISDAPRHRDTPRFPAHRNKSCGADVSPVNSPHRSQRCQTPMVIPQILTQRATDMTASATPHGAGRSPSWPSRSCWPSRTTCTARSPAHPHPQMTRRHRGSRSRHRRSPAGSGGNDRTARVQGAVEKSFATRPRSAGLSGCADETISARRSRVPFTAPIRLLRLRRGLVLQMLPDICELQECGLVRQPR
jgi:hypothetical protein